MSSYAPQIRPLTRNRPCRPGKSGHGGEEGRSSAEGRRAESVRATNAVQRSRTRVGRRCASTAAAGAAA